MAIDAVQHIPEIIEADVERGVLKVTAAKENAVQLR